MIFKLAHAAHGNIGLEHENNSASFTYAQEEIKL